jgi:AraC-like DNA-binding protein
MMTLNTFTAAAQLQPFVKCYYLMESDYRVNTKDAFFADGCIEVVFHTGVQFYRGEEKECWAKVIGQITKPLTMVAKGKGKSFGIWFWPHTFSGFARVPMNELNDKAIPLDTIFSGSFIDFVGNCLSDNGVEDLLKGVDHYLIKKLQPSSHPDKDKLVDYAVRHISTHKDHACLDSLVRECTISNRYLQKLFLERVGFSPNFFKRIIRFQNALRYLVDGQADSYTALAYLAGYYDQPHFIRDFKEFTGLTPSQFQFRKHPINEQFLKL